MIAIDGALMMLLADACPVGEALRDRVQGERLLAAFDDLPIRRLEHVPLLPRVRELFANLSAYDATYVALAEGFDVPLVTSDGRIKDGARAKQAKCAVEVFNEKTLPPAKSG